MQLQDTVAVVTGGNSGLGLALCRVLLEKGCQVFVLGKDDKKVAQAVAELGENAYPLPADVCDYPSLEKVATSVEKVDILINAAGVYIGGALEDNDPEQIAKTIDVNLRGPIYTTKAFLSKLSGGFIVNVSSSVGIRTKPQESVYGASKFGLRGFTESLQEEVQPRGIKVMGFYPGGMNTKLFEKGGSPKENALWMDPQKVAQLLVTLLEADDSMTVTHIEVNRKK